MSFSYTQHADCTDYADETILHDYAKLRHNYALQARGYASNLIELVPSYPLHKKKRCSRVDPAVLKAIVDVLYE